VTRGGLARAALPAVIGGGLVVLGLRLHAAADDLDRARLPGAGTIALVVGLALVGQVAFGLGWDRLLPSVRDRTGLAWSFHGSQPAKYVPVGVAQPLGQIALVRRLGVERGPAAVAWACQIATIVTAGVLLGAPLALVEDGPRWLRLTALGLLAPVLVARPVLAAALGAARRVLRRVPEVTTLPGQGALLEAFLASLVALALHATAFALVAQRSGGPGLVRLGAAYALATGLSVATPVPAGLGVREAIIIAAAGLPAAAALAAALLFRVVLLAVELGLFALAGGLAGGKVRRARGPGPPEDGSGP